MGQPLEVLKTQMAANRSQTMFQALQTVWSRGGVTGFYQGLIPWVCTRMLSSVAPAQSVSQAWIEASTKGAVLLFTASEIESTSVSMGINPAAAGLLGGMGGGIAQAYATMGKWHANLPDLRVFPPQTPSSGGDTHIHAN